VAADSAALSFEAAAAEGTVRVDGVLDEAVWRTAERIPLPYETFPGSNAPSPVATDCRIAYDQEALYLGCRAVDPDPGSIRAYISDRDRLDEAREGAEGAMAFLSQGSLDVAMWWNALAYCTAMGWSIEGVTRFRNAGALAYGLSGTGPASFGLFQIGDAEAFLDKIPDEEWIDFLRTGLV